MSEPTPPGPYGEVDALHHEIITAYNEQGTIPFVTLNLLLTSAVALADPIAAGASHYEVGRAERALKRLREAAEACR